MELHLRAEQSDRQSQFWIVAGLYEATCCTQSSGSWLWWDWDVPVDEPRLCSLLDSIDPGLKAPRQTFSVHIVQTHEQNGVNGPDRSSMNRFGLTASLIVFFYYERNEAESFFFLLFFYFSAAMKTNGCARGKSQTHRLHFSDTSGCELHVNLPSG